MSHTNLLYHIVFATKGRAPLIIEALRPRLHEYLGGTVRNLGGTALFDELPVQLLDARSCTAGNESWKARPLRL
jgi:hypothetical protein